MEPSKKLGEDPGDRARSDAALRPVRPLRPARRGQGRRKAQARRPAQGHRAARRVDLELALKLLSLPREVGKHPEDGEPIVAGIGRFGPYVQHDKTYANLENGDEVFTIGLNRAVTLIAEKIAKGPRKGRFGADPGRALGDHPAERRPDHGQEGPLRALREPRRASTRRCRTTSPPRTVTLEQAVELHRRARRARPAPRTGGAPRARRTAAAPRQAGDRRRPAAAKPPKAARPWPRAGRQSKTEGRLKAKRRHTPEMPGNRTALTILSASSRRTTFYWIRIRSPNALSPRRTTCSPSSPVNPARSARASSRAPSGSRTPTAPPSRPCCASSPTKAASSAAARSCTMPAPCPPWCWPTSPARDRDGELIAVPREWDSEAARRGAENPHPGAAQGAARRDRRRRRPRADQDRGGRRRRRRDPPPRPRHQADRARQAARARHLPQRRRAAAGWCRSTRRTPAASWRSRPGAPRDAQDGDLVAVEVQQGRPLRPAGRPRQGTARLAREREGGEPDRDPRARHPARLSQATCCTRPSARGRRRSSGREDWREVPLVTIDPVDAKDHDDAVFAPRRHRPRPIRGGFIIDVAIADVAHYVHARLRARPRGAGARQLGLFPRPRRADAARAHLQRPVLAAAGRGSRRARGAHGDRRRRPQALAHASIAC